MRPGSLSPFPGAPCLETMGFGILSGTGKNFFLMFFVLSFSSYGDSISKLPRQPCTQGSCWLECLSYFNQNGSQPVLATQHRLYSLKDQN